MINSQEEILIDIFDNTTAVYEYRRQNYYLLIKKQKNKDYCTLFLTDCTDNFWIQKIDLNFCQELKQQIKLKSDIKSFAQHLVKGIKENGIILQISPKPRIKVCMKVSDGLIINATLKIQLCINQQEEPQSYKKLLKNFFKQLYEAKDVQVAKVQSKVKIQEKDKSKVNKQDPEFIKSGLNVGEKKQAPPPPKNRDLINPYRKKRKNQGLKLGEQV